jgi:hypothetical protein
LRRATGGAEGRQTSIGNLSYHRSNSNIKGNSQIAHQINMNLQREQASKVQPKRTSFEDFDGTKDINPPAILGSKSFTNPTSLNATKATLMKMIHDKSGNQEYSSHQMVQTYLQSSS